VLGVLNPAILKKGTQWGDPPGLLDRKTVIKSLFYSVPCQTGFFVGFFGAKPRYKKKRYPVGGSLAAFAPKNMHSATVESYLLIYELIRKVLPGL
jgi:hypothetical protein